HLRRRAQAAMARIHEGRRVDREVREIGSEMRALARRARVRGVGEVGAVHDALQEAVEATLLDRISRGEPLPGRGALGVGPEAYLTGLGDLAGEIRRLALAALSEGRLEVARQRLREMDSVYRLLLRFEAPRAIVSLKPKQDTARALLERTRGDVALAEVLARAGLSSHRKRSP
ncbi:MAG TPA: hypothetical protein VLY85_04265, partial [Thermoplasmata archaeon]|nr:hypothetical protein [Thermoplasmata archaeon]